MSETTQVSGGGIGLLGIVFIVFLILKLAGIGVVATWSWWWVTAPLWGPVVFGLGICAIALVIAIPIAVIVGIVKASQG